MPSSVKLGAKLEDYVDKLVERGRYGSRSEVLREGIRLVHERESWLERVEHAVAEGRADIAAGRYRDMDEVFDELEERFRPN